MAAKAKHRRQCARKKRFATELLAESWARLFSQSIYQCTICGWWHCSSTERKIRLSRRTPAV